MQIASGERGAPRAGGLRRRVTKRRTQEIIWAYLFLSPFLIHLVLFTAGPIIAALILSFTSYDGLGVVEPRFIGIDNYERALSSTTVRAAFQNTAYYVLIYVPSTLSIALLAAIALNQKVRGVLWFRAAFFVPVVTSGVATAIMWLWVLNHNGLMNYVIGLIGIKPVSWFGFDMAFNSIIMIGVWGGLGVIMMFWLAALQGVPEHLYEAAKVDGAGWWASFRHVTAPALTPMALFLTILGVIGSFQVFVSTFVISNGTGGPGNATLTVALLIYQQGFSYYYMGYASAIAYLLFVAVFIVTIVQWRLQRYWVFYD